MINAIEKAFKISKPDLICNKAMESKNTEQIQKPISFGKLRMNTTDYRT